MSCFLLRKKHKKVDILACASNKTQKAVTRNAKRSNGLCLFFSKISGKLTVKTHQSWPPKIWFIEANFSKRNIFN